MNKDFKKNDNRTSLAHTIFQTILFICAFAILAVSIVYMVLYSFMAGLVALVFGELGTMGAYAFIEMLFSFLTDIKFIRNELHVSNDLNSAKNVGAADESAKELEEQ